MNSTSDPPSLSISVESNRSRESSPPMRSPVPIATLVSQDSSVEFNTSEYLCPESAHKLSAMGFPKGLVKLMGKSRATYPVRFWVVDNSSSMEAMDGEELVVPSAELTTRNNQQSPTIVACSRWQELQSTVICHAELAGLLTAPTTFRLLNGNTNASSLCIADPHDMTASMDKNVLRVQQCIRKSRPNGCTPLTEHLKKIYTSIQAIEKQLRSQDQRAVVVIATDGLPSDAAGRTNRIVTSQFLDSLRRLQELPVWVVIRLCTDEKHVVDFYSTLDSEYEMSLDVLDDFCSEAKEVEKYNPWLNYALPLHRCREMGCHNRVLDMLDERSLCKDQLKKYIGILLGDDKVLRNAPDIHTEWKKFLAYLEPLVKQMGKTWNPRTRKLAYWIDMKKLNRTYGHRAMLPNVGKLWR